MSKEYESNQYDAIYATGGYEGVYELPYWHSGYLPLFTEVQRRLAARGSKSVLEVGCGTGAFAHLLRDKSPGVAYRGFDFSPVAVARSAKRISSPESFYVADARLEASYSSKFDAIVCTEVLEHIEADLEVVSRWPAGTYCVCSVPNFDADNHVRVFKHEREITERYGKLIDIERVQRIKKPFLSDISTRHTLRALLWNRYRPARFLAILGLASFETLGGWFLFSGVRKA